MTNPKTPRFANVDIETGRFPKGNLGDIRVYASRYHGKTKIHARIVTISEEGDTVHTVRGVAVDLVDARAFLEAFAAAIEEATKLQAEADTGEAT